MAELWTTTNDNHAAIGGRSQALVTEWTSYEVTTDQVQTSLALLVHQNKLIQEPADTLEQKQARIHEQKSVCFSVDQLTPRFVGVSGNTNNGKCKVSARTTI